MKEAFFLWHLRVDKFEHKNFATEKYFSFESVKHHEIGPERTHRWPFDYPFRRKEICFKASFVISRGFLFDSSL